MKRFSKVRIVALAALAVSASFVPVAKADEYNRKTVITISNPVEVPGVVLPAGTYVMRLFNSSSNRHIVQFMNEDQTRQLALTFTAAAERIRPTGKTVLTMYEGSRTEPAAVRTWYYPGDTVGQEFLYPRQQALHISARTHVAVPEIETGKSVSIAERSVSEKEETTKVTEPVLVARAEPAPAPIAEPTPEPVAPEPAPAPELIAAPEPQRQSEVAVTESQSSTSPTPESLPKTAGETALAGLIGTLSLGIALGMRKLRQYRSQ